MHGNRSEPIVSVVVVASEASLPQQNVVVEVPTMVLTLPLY